MNDSLIVSGYALYWGEKAFIDENNSRFYEQFQRGAFSESIQNRKQKVLLFHKKEYEIKANLTLMEDEKGLAFRMELPNDSDGNMVFELVRNSDLKHVSIGFQNATVELGEYRHFALHSIRKAELVEISLVVNPAYKTSSVRTGCSNKRLELLSKINLVLNG